MAPGLEPRAIGRPGALVPLRQVLWRARRLPPSMIIGGAILAVYVIAALTGPWWIPYGPSDIGVGMPFEGASAQHLFGTDDLGRDVFSRAVIGTRTDLSLALAGTVLGCVSGAIVGLLSAYFGGWIDEVLMRVVDGVISIPFLIFALLVINAAGPDRAGDPTLLIAIVALIYAPRMARMARATALEVMTTDFVLIARTRGEGPLSIVFREVLPNTWGTLLVEFAVRLGNAPLVIGSLGFLGFGIRPPTPEWGLMISEDRSALLTAPVIVLGPAAVLAVLVIGINLFADGLARLLGRSILVGG
jgi:peptide/nickel transport system permease protein